MGRPIGLHLTTIVACFGDKMILFTFTTLLILGVEFFQSSGKERDFLVLKSSPLHY